MHVNMSAITDVYEESLGDLWAQLVSVAGRRLTRDVQCSADLGYITRLFSNTQYVLKRASLEVRLFTEARMHSELTLSLELV